ncbi:hypothetical protein CCUS01_01378 [Colletotrichum cuscutae]|uniref:Uncharacterized protein n=1 Tax=Colletotrichum cuscutae TaxID=1209917 RepID=A0AAI9UTH9_9PEZI|nr:hypothetical protein CCUS01_01378 [Colletotrichum cuscutae]
MMFRRLSVTTNFELASVWSRCRRVEFDLRESMAKKAKAKAWTAWTRDNANMIRISGLAWWSHVVENQGGSGNVAVASWTRGGCPPLRYSIDRRAAAGHVVGKGYWMDSGLIWAVASDSTGSGWRPRSGLALLNLGTGLKSGHEFRRILSSRTDADHHFDGKGICGRRIAIREMRVDELGDRKLESSVWFAGTRNNFDHSTPIEFSDRPRVSGMVLESCDELRLSTMTLIFFATVTAVLVDNKKSQNFSVAAAIMAASDVPSATTGMGNGGEKTDRRKSQEGKPESGMVIISGWCVVQLETWEKRDFQEGRNSKDAKRRYRRDASNRDCKVFVACGPTAACELRPAIFHPCNFISLLSHLRPDRLTFYSVTSLRTQFGVEKSRNSENSSGRGLSWMQRYHGQLEIQQTVGPLETLRVRGSAAGSWSLGRGKNGRNMEAVAEWGSIGTNRNLNEKEGTDSVSSRSGGRGLRSTENPSIGRRIMQSGIRGRVTATFFASKDRMSHPLISRCRHMQDCQTRTAKSDQGKLQEYPEGVLPLRHTGSAMSLVSIPLFSRAPGFCKSPSEDKHLSSLVGAGAGDIMVSGLFGPFHSRLGIGDYSHRTLFLLLKALGGFRTVVNNGQVRMCWWFTRPPVFMPLPWRIPCVICDRLFAGSGERVQSVEPHYATASRDEAHQKDRDDGRSSLCLQILPIGDNVKLESDPSHISIGNSIRIFSMRACAVTDVYGAYDDEDNPPFSLELPRTGDEYSPRKTLVLAVHNIVAVLQNTKFRSRAK